MVCALDVERPCTSSSRSKNRYTRKEVEVISKECGFKRVQGVSMDDLCVAIIDKMKLELHKQSTPDTKKLVQGAIKSLSEKTSTPTPFATVKISEKVSKVDAQKDMAKVITPPKEHEMINQQPVEHKHPSQVMFERFKEYFKEDLIGFLDAKKPKFRVVTAGGYGLKTLMETKHKIFGKVKTGDVDFTVSTYRCSMTPLACFQYWARKLHAFFADQIHPSDFQVKVINFGHAYVPVMNFHRDYVLMVTYKNEEFVDVAITNQKVTAHMLDKATSLKAGIPVKKEDYYLKEFLSLIYMETVPGVNTFCYAKRNPITGMYSCKGVKDIDRSKLLCSVKKRNKYMKYCELLQDVTVAKLKRMPPEKRDRYFSSLRDIISPAKKEA